MVATAGSGPTITERSIDARLRVTALAIALAVGGCGDPAPPEATRITVSPSSAALRSLGDTVRLTAAVLDQNGMEMPDLEVTWASRHNEVATVDGTGLAVAVANGSAEVVAAVDGVAGSAVLTVAQRAAELRVSPLTDTLVVPDTVRLAAEAFDANGHRVAEVGFEWSSGDESVATVDARGLVTGVGAGSVVVTVAESTAGLEETVSLVVWGARQVLMTIYEALGGEGWTNAHNWGTDAPLDEWYGVTADGAGRIIGLDLGGNGLTGPVPPELGRLETLREAASPSQRVVGFDPAGAGESVESGTAASPSQRFVGFDTVGAGESVKSGTAVSR